MLMSLVRHFGVPAMIVLVGVVAGLARGDRARGYWVTPGRWHR